MNKSRQTLAVAELAKKYGLDFVVLFGSQATGKTHADSDMDIAVITREKINMARLAMDFDEVFKRNDIEVINLSNASPTLMHVVSRDGQLLYERELDLYLNWKVYAAKIWMDTEWFRQLRNRKLRDWSQDYNASHV